MAFLKKLYVNVKELAKSVFQQAKRPLLEASNNAGLERFNEAKRQLLLDVRNHPVSVEIAGGIGENNISGTLSGRGGNLYSFFGFQAGRRPVDDLVRFLDENVVYVPARDLTLKDIGRNVFYGVGEAKAFIPSYDEFKVLNFDWETGRSWVYAVEEGVSNLAYYLATYGHGNSRSGRGIQVDHPVFSVNFNRTDYITGMLNNFRRRLQ